jgi:hypothetical protein
MQPKAQSGMPPQMWNATNAGGQNSVTFSGVPLADGASVNVTYGIAGVGSGKPLATQFSFNEGSPQSTEIKSKDLTGNVLSFDPFGTGFIATLDLVNDFDTRLTGAVSVYVNTGFPDFFNLDDYATLRNATLVFSSDYSLDPGGGFLGLTATLPSVSDFLLILGTADSGDGLGPEPFSEAISPLAVPEPDLRILLPIGLIALLGARRGLKYSKLAPNPRTSAITRGHSLQC